MRTLITGWRLSGIYKKATGAYLTPLTGLDRALSGFAGNQRPNQILENPYGDPHSPNYLNPKAFAQPDVGTIGNMRTSSIAGLGTWQFDMALSERIPAPLAGPLPSRPTRQTRMAFRLTAIRLARSSQHTIRESFNLR
jgi:hypothetical protein